MNTRKKISALVPALILALSPLAFCGDSVGLNFSLAGNAATEMGADDKAGAEGVEQASWNNLPGTSGTNGALKDGGGKDVAAMAVAWSVPEGDTAWRIKAGADWGFKDGNLKMQTGFIQLGATLKVSAIPYAKYDVYVYLEAEGNGGKGSVTISSAAGGIDPKSTYFYKFGWLGGKFVRATSVDQATAADANYVVFTGNTAKEFSLDWNGGLDGGWTGVSGVQIVAVP